jgi:hypothetical protein
MAETKEQPEKSTSEDEGKDLRADRDDALGYSREVIKNTGEEDIEHAEIPEEDQPKE